MGIGGGAVAEQLGVGRRAAARGRFGVLQHEQRRALAHDEAVAPDIERSRGAVRLVVVARGQGPDDVERTERERRQRDLAAAGDRGVDAALAQVTERLAQRDRARGTRIGRGQDRAADVERDAEVGRGGAAEDRQREVRGDLPDALLEVALVLFLGVGDAPERRTEIDPDALGAGRAVRAGDEARVVQRETTGDHPELAEPVELTRGLRRHPRERVEVVDLGGDLGAERGRIESIDPLDRRARFAQTGPERIDARPDRRDQTDARDPDPPAVGHVDGFVGAAAAGLRRLVHGFGQRLERRQCPTRDRPGEEPIDERGEARQPGREFVLDRHRGIVASGSLSPPIVTGSMRQVTSIPLVAPATWTKRRRRVAGSDQVRERQVTGSPSPRTRISGRYAMKSATRLPSERRSTATDRA